MRIVLDIRKSIEENASAYFDKAKKAKKKQEGLAEALAQTRRKMAALEKEKDRALAELEKQEEAAQKKKERKKAWYEKYRWFKSSEGFLCIGGRDATTNEILIKKHTDSGDAVFHTDMAGSPFFVLKADTGPEGRKPGKATLQEAASATACFSRAWRAGMMASDVFYVKPGQVSKEAQSGEYLAKGAFMIKGKTNYVKDTRMELGIGVDRDGRAMCGPLAAVKRHCSKTLGLRPGTTKPSDLAKQIRKTLGSTDLDEIIRALPAGNSSISE